MNWLFDLLLGPKPRDEMIPQWLWIEILSYVLGIIVALSSDVVIYVARMRPILGGVTTVLVLAGFLVQVVLFAWMARSVSIHWVEAFGKVKNSNKPKRKEKAKRDISHLMWRGEALQIISDEEEQKQKRQ